MGCGVLHLTFFDFVYIYIDMYNNGWNVEYCIDFIYIYLYLCGTWINRDRVSEEILLANIHVIAEALAHQIYNLSADDNISIFPMLSVSVLSFVFFCFLFYCAAIYRLM